ncbi:MULTISPECIES: TdeIII family type II restriction endonuclease [Bacteroides]|uniref:TdeIII family type II restriction endonuclease n=1 Tax=Bacteroides TaxID=816 RepID=UPI000E43FFC1|nr:MULTISPECIES: TdeIII family type II restriction endonuclease [Bacteroides]RGM45215.1 TdeIII family type II restriction endonuclease [Bacteroides sp. OM08-11]
MNQVDNEKVIRAIVSAFVESYASGFSDRHISEKDDEDGTINMKIHNVFIAALGPEIQYYSALARSLDSSLGNMLEKMAIKIATLHYKVSQHVEGKLYKEQTDFIAELLEQYKRREIAPSIDDYTGITNKTGNIIRKRHESDYYLLDEETNMHYLIELKIGGDLDNKKARSEKEALLEQYCILTNELNDENKVKILFATAYNRYGEGAPWTQSRVRQFFAPDELCISRNFWNLVCKSENGYDIVIDEYKKSAHFINDALNNIKNIYLPNIVNERQ